MKNSRFKQTEVTRIQNVFRLSGRLKTYSRRIAGAIFCGIGHQLSTVAVSAIGAYLVGLAIEGTLPEKIKETVILLSVAIVAKIIFYFLEMWFAHDVAFKVLADFRVQLLAAIERVSPAILLNMRSGQLASTLMSDVELLEWFFAHSFGSIIVAVIAPLILLICLGRIHPLLPLLLVIFLCVLVVIPVWMKKQADRQGREVREQLGDANAVTMEGIQGMKEILSLNYRTAYKKKNEAYMSRFYGSQLAYGKRLGTEGALLQAVLGIAMLSVTAVAAGMVLKGQIAASWYPVVVILAGTILGPVVEVCNTARNFGLIFAAADRVYRVLEAKAQVEDRGQEHMVSKINPAIAFEHVSFRYRPDLPDAVRDISFTVEPGQTVALVGFSGAGKSTCMNLLMRYWDVDQGAVKISDVDLRDMTLENLHQLTSVVLQDVYLFRDTIRENIRLGKPDATDEEVEQAARRALAHEFIMDLPKGYDTVAGESGMKLSGGQRQRIAIARAFLKKAPILILDEAVSNLDTENEKEIQESIRNSGQMCTTVIVAHRLSTIRSADKIVVLKEGRVEQIGTYEVLASQNGFFKELISSGSEKDREEKEGLRQS